ncbi:unnamed protein product [Ectocarpus sp. 4 AP-2014]
MRRYPRRLDRSVFEKNICQHRVLQGKAVSVESKTANGKVATYIRFLRRPISTIDVARTLEACCTRFLGLSGPMMG